MRVNETTAKRTRARGTASDAPISILRPSDDQIRARAYDIFLRRGGRPGDPVDDWFAAERELINEAPAQIHSADALIDEPAPIHQAPATANQAPARPAKAPAKRSRKPRSKN
jgi:hypothetical protein